MTIMDMSIIGVALPEIQADLAFRPPARVTGECRTSHERRSATPEIPRAAARADDFA
jgi:hypothetical protein